MSDAYARAKPSGLRLKGMSDGDKSKKHKKKRKRKHSEKEDLDYGESTDEKASVKHGKWYQIREMEQLQGVLFIQSCKNEAYLYAEPDATFKMGPTHASESVEDGPEPAELFLIVPAGTGLYALKSGYQRYVGMNVSGSLTGYAEAIGSLEQWTIELDPITHTAQFKSSTNKYMCVLSNGNIGSCSTAGTPLSKEEDVSNTATEQKQETTPHLTTLDLKKTFRIYTDKKVETSTEKKAKYSLYQGDLDTLAKNAMMKAQSFQGGNEKHHSSLSRDDRKSLKLASKEGLLNEELLNRRAKKKSDKFCK